MDTTTTTVAQEAVQHSIPGWAELLVILCILGFVYFFVVHPIIMEHRMRINQARKTARIADSIPRTEHRQVRSSRPAPLQPDQRLIAELRTILDRSKLGKEIRPADVRQHLKAKGWDISEDRILRAMGELREISGYRWTSKDQLIIWRLPNQSDNRTSATALSHED